jgi:PAS domain-containing protein
MTHTLPSRSGLSTASRLLYLGVAAFVALAFFTARAVWRAFDERAGQARAAAVFDLVATRTAPRPTDAPGAMAWLRRSVGGGRRASAESALADPADAVPPVLAPLAAALYVEGESMRLPQIVYRDAESDPASVRLQRFVHVEARTLVLTRRRLLEAAQNDADPAAFVPVAAHLIMSADRRLRDHLSRQRMPAALDDRPARIVRTYAVHEDGSLLSLPWVDEVRSDASNRAADTERSLLAARPTLPAFAPDDFFFRSTTDAYSGFYLDLGGRGLVSTITAPFTSADAGRAVMALDLAFDVDWTAMAASLDPPIAGAAIALPAGAPASWTAFADALPAAAPEALRQALRDAASRTGMSEVTAPSAPLRHAVGDAGAVAAFQVSDLTWLLAWFPQTTASFPFAAVALLTVMLGLLLTGFEVNRRRAHSQRRTAEQALQEKQNLLNTMQVPLVVVDPNTDAIVSANRAAEAIGLNPGRRFADLVWPEPRSREHYERMQVASSEPRRAYGVPVAVPEPDGTLVRRYAVVRSVAVTAPIEALNADERHRLGVVIVLDQAPDLSLLIDEIESAAHRDERRRLAGLLSHGVDSLARVLEYSLARRHDAALAAWLAEYLERRVSVTAWLLDHWDASPPLPADSVIDGALARATIDRFVAVLAVVAAERELRQRLHWDNGTLSAPATPLLSVAIDWPDDVVITCPVQGGFGLFLHELVANAVRHGAPGTTPAFSITCDRTRGELRAELANRPRAEDADPSREEAYGGLSILKAMTRLFEWPLAFDRPIRDGDRWFVASWVMPFSTRRRTEAD